VPLVQAKRVEAERIEQARKDGCIKIKMAKIKFTLIRRVFNRIGHGKNNHLEKSDDLKRIPKAEDISIVRIGRSVKIKNRINYFDEQKMTYE
jgi:hypothetical protein